MHGCTKQGGPAIPEVNCYFSTFGHCDILHKDFNQNWKVLYKDLWVHTMYSQGSR